MKLKKIFTIAAMAALMASCGGNTKTENVDTVAVEDTAAFYESQPVANAQYRVNSYDIEGEKARKGKFDGRMMVALGSPDKGEPSAIYIFENGNRAKIEYKVILSRPFEKGDSDIYRALDTNELPVVIMMDSTQNYISFEKKNEKVKLGYDADPMTMATYIEMIERINAASKK